MLGTTNSDGALGVVVLRRPAKERLDAILGQWKPRSNLGLVIAQAVPHLPYDLACELVERVRSSLVAESSLAVKVRYAGARSWEDHGIVGHKMVTDAGVGYIVDAMQNSVEAENMKYHALGTGTTAEAATGAGATMVTELTTEYTGNVRTAGTTAEGASANIFQSVCTSVLDGTPGAALREHGLFSASSAGVCFDRTLFAAITLSSGDSIATTYSWTLSSGG